MASTILQSATYQDLLGYLLNDLHNETTALHGEGVLRNLSVGQYLARVEANAAKHPGNWFYGPFNDLVETRRYTTYVAGLGKSRIRENSALPHIWSDFNRGNPVDVIRVYQVIHPTPAIASFAAPQEEAGTYAATPNQIAAIRSGTYRHEPKYPGEGHQLAVPVSCARAKHNLFLVKHLPSEDMKVTLP